MYGKSLWKAVRCGEKPPQRLPDNTYLPRPPGMSVPQPSFGGSLFITCLEENFRWYESLDSGEMEIYISTDKVEICQTNSNCIILLKFNRQSDCSIRAVLVRYRTATVSLHLSSPLSSLLPSLRANCSIINYLGPLSTYSSSVSEYLQRLTHSSY